MAKKKRGGETNLFLLSIVGIVAIVGIVVLVMNASPKATWKADDLAGQAWVTDFRTTDQIQKYAPTSGEIGAPGPKQADSCTDLGLCCAVWKNGRCAKCKHCD